MFGLDGEEKAYADFNKQKLIYPQPPFVVNPFHYQEGTYEAAVANQQTCKQNLKVDQHDFRDIPLERGKILNTKIIKLYY